jgi:protein-disulfide isomerase
MWSAQTRTKQRDDPMPKIFQSWLVAFALGASVMLSGQQQQQPTDAAARVGDRVITLKDVDEAWKKAEPAEHGRAWQALYEGRRQTLDRIIADMLIEQAAKTRGISAEQYLKEEIAKRNSPVTDPEIEAFYEQNKAQLQGKPLADMRGAIRNFLGQQKTAAARASLVAELRKAGPPIRTMIDPPRQSIEIASNDPVRGNAGAPVTIVEFSDYQCPFCGRVTPTLAKIREVYGDRVKFVWKDFPLTQIHPQAFKASEAAHCAGDQGKYWEFHDRLFANQQALQPDALKKHAAELGLNASAFNECFDSSKYRDRVREGMGQGEQLGVSSTPSLFINGRLVAGAVPYESFVEIIDEELQRR